MNRIEVITSIRRAGNHFGRVMECLVTAEYAAGYKQAVADMVRFLICAPIDPDFETERRSMIARIKELTAENKELKKTITEQADSIDTLMKHVDICKVLGIKGVKR